MRDTQAEQKAEKRSENHTIETIYFKDNGKNFWNATKQSKIKEKEKVVINNETKKSKKDRERNKGEKKVKN